MSIFRKRFALLLASATLMPLAPAFAADYDPPVVVDQADEYVPVEVGSGWYLRGDVGYMLDKNFDDDYAATGPFPDDDDFGTLVVSSFDDSENDVFGSVGFGYHFTDYLRADINIGLLPTEKFDLGDDLGSDISLRSKNTYWNGLVNGYVDLGTYAGFTPYVGAGAGLIYSKVSVDGTVSCAPGSSFADNGTGQAVAELYCPSDTGTAVVDYSKHEYDALYSASAGFAYQIARNTSLDVGYQYMIAPDVKYVKLDHDGVAIGEGVDSHSIKIGLRYDLW